MIILSYWKEWYGVSIKNWTFLEAGEAKTTIDSHHAQVINILIFQIFDKFALYLLNYFVYL